MPVAGLGAPEFCFAGLNGEIVPLAAQKVNKVCLIKCEIQTVTGRPADDHPRRLLRGIEKPGYKIFGISKDDEGSRRKRCSCFVICILDMPAPFGKVTAFWEGW